MFTIQFVFGLTVTTGLLLIGHWAPWPRKLRRLEAYTYGVTSILAGQAVWLGLQHEWQLLLSSAAFAGVGGVVVGSAYLLDWILNQLIRNRLPGSIDGRDH